MGRRTRTPLPAYLLSVRDAESAIAHRDLRRLGVEHWHPQYLEYLSDGPEARPLFPGYAFARMGDGDFPIVEHARGVFGVVRFGDEFARVPDRVWSELRALCGDSGYVRLKPRFNRWSRVRLLDSGSGGSVGIVQERLAANRVRVLFHLLGRPVEMSVADGALQAA